MKRARFRRACLNTLAGMLGIALMSLFFIFCHDIILQSPYFKVTSMNVSGNSRLSVPDVLEAARIRSDTNVLMVNLPLARKYLLSHPWIAEAEILRDLPGKLTISVKEHEPVAVLNMGRKFLINQEGKVFKELSESDTIDLPIIEGIDYTDLDHDDLRRSAHFDAIFSLLEMRRNPSCILSRLPVRLIHLDREEGITIFSSGPTLAFHVNAVKVGYQDYVEKFVRLEKIIAYFKTSKVVQGIEWIDLRQMNRVVISPMSIEPRSDSRKEI